MILIANFQLKNILFMILRGSSGIIAEMMIAGGVECFRLLRILTEAIFTHDTVPKDWEES